MTKEIRNIGIIAHVDAGKTTITEQMLATCGVIAKAGRVDHGSAVTDALALERKRGISIKATPVSFMYRDVKINLIDTPGHVDFVAEVERALGVLDSVVLVVSAREGLQTQTRLFIRILRDLKLPCVIFINKTDRAGSDVHNVMSQLAVTFAGNVLPMQTIIHEGTRDVSCLQRGYRELLEGSSLLCDRDEALMEQFVRDMPVSDAMIEEVLTALTRKAEIYPVLMGSALHGIGVSALLDAVIAYLPAPNGNADAAFAAAVFKVDAHTAERTAYTRVYDGSIRVRDAVNYRDKTEKIVRLKLLENGCTIPGECAEAGDVCVLYIKDLRCGDVIGTPSGRMRDIVLARPALSARVEPENPADKRRLFEALTVMADEDPMIALQQRDGEPYVHLFGEVQMDVILAMLREDYGIAARMENPRPIYKDTPAESGEAAITMRETHLAAGVGFSVEPLPRDAGLQYRSDVWLGSLEKSFQNAVEEAVYTTCKTGINGQEITDVLIVFNYSQYDSVNSTPADYRRLTPQVLEKLFRQTGLRVLEPVMAFELICPETAAGKALYDCRRMEADIHDTHTEDDMFTVTGLVPFERCRSFLLELASYTEGQGLFVTRLHGYREAKHRTVR